MLFSFECECGAQQDWSGPSAEKPETLTCNVCGGEAKQSLCLNFIMRKSAPDLPSPKQLCRALFERKNARIRANEHKIRARDRQIVETARNRIKAERSRPKTHGSADGIEHAVVPMRLVREHEMVHGHGSWATLMQDKKALKKTLSEHNLWLSGE